MKINSESNELSETVEIVEPEPAFKVSSEVIERYPDNSITIRSRTRLNQ